MENLVFFKLDWGGWFVWNNVTGDHNIRPDLRGLLFLSWVSLNVDLNGLNEHASDPRTVYVCRFCRL